MCLYTRRRKFLWTHAPKKKIYTKNQFAYFAF